MTKMKAVTMKDIAEAMQVSVVTVSKALAGKRGVSEQMRGKIIQKSQEMGYLYAGRPLERAERSGNIGVLVADRFFTDNSFYSSMYRALVLACGAAGFSVLLEIVTPQNEADGVLPNFLSSNKGDGVIFMGEIHPDYIRAVSKTGVPHMLLDFYDDANPDDSVVSDGVFGAYQLTSYLVETGHRKIGFVGSLLATSSILDRYLGYYKALLRHELALQEEWVLPDRGEDGRFIAINLPRNMPEAFVCNCDETAYLLIETLKEHGYRVPEDVSVVGFDDFRFATLSNPALTTFHVDVEAMGRAAVSQLLRKIRRRQYVKGRTIINGELVIRDSVCARGDRRADKQPTQQNSRGA